MGTQTTHTLSTFPANAKRAAKMVADVVGYDPFSGACKWYDREVDMIAVSIMQPTIIFTVHGISDEHDEWVMHFHAGKMITYERDDWNPPPIPDSMIANRITACAAATQKQSATTERRERAMLATLQAKYGDDS